MLQFLFSLVLPPPGTDEESRLLVRIARADRAALKALFDRLGAQALGVAVRVLGSRTDAEDVLQETFVDVWGRSTQFDPARGTGRAWVLRMVRNRAIDRLRTRGAISRMVDRVGEDQKSGTPPASGIEVLEQREARSRVQAALDILSDEQRHVLELAYFEGLTHSEIAAKLNEPLGTVKSRVRAALDKLAQVIPPEGARS